MYKKSLKAKIILFGALGILITSIITIAFTSITAYKNTKEQVETYVISETKSYSQFISGEMGVALEPAKQLSSILSAAKSNSFGFKLSRDDVHAMLKKMTEDTPELLGVFTVWEPNAFDGRDSEFKNTKYHGKMGNFVPYWVRGTNGIVAGEACTGDEELFSYDYYAWPKKSLKEEVVDPLAWEAQGKMVFSSSLVHPIIVDGRFLGIVGTEVPLDFIQSLADEANLFGKQGRIAIVSNNGTIAGMTGKKELVSKKNELSEKIAKYFSNNKNLFLDYHKGELVVAVPYRVGQSSKQWYVVAEIPETIITGPIWSMIIEQIIIVTILVVVVVIVLGVFSGSIANKILNGVGALGVVSEELHTSAQSMSQAGTVLASSSTEQASSIQETSASLEELTGMVNNNLENARGSSKIFEEVRLFSTDGAQAMEGLNNSMEQIKRTNDKVQQLVQVISNIADRTKVIDEIVFQTKLLSFNASVEAERAGEHGRGFAVVAQEVGSLAQMSGKAAQEINEMVSSSMGEVESITKENREKVEEGSKFLSETSAILKKIVDHTHLATQSSKNILQASEEQAKGIEQINMAVVQLDQTTQQTAAMAEKAAHEGGVLSDQSKKLSRVVSELKNLVTG